MEKITMEAVEACLKSLGITYELSQAQALVTFCETLLKWNTTYNLTTITDASSVLTLHVADSLTLVPKVKEFAPAAKRVLDVGSGGGLPRGAVGGNAAGFVSVGGGYGQKESRVPSTGWGDVPTPKFYGLQRPSGKVVVASF